jgi:DNA-binding winged helix-turn-helix (wHTH) protein
LPLFECPGFCFKLLLPARLEHSLGSAGAALRGRVNWHKLEWSRAQLQEIVEKRLAVALNQESFSLDELAEKTDDGSAEKTGDEADKQAGDGTAENTGDETAEKAGDEADKKTGDRTAEKAGDEANKQTGDETAEKAGDETGEKGDRPTESRGLLDWLSRCGGELPRGWVGAVRPFLDAYIQAGRIPLSVEECAAIQERNPPRLYINPDTGEILVGHRPVAELTEGLDAVLHHLYRQRGRVCSRRDLYLTYMDALYPDRERKSVLTASDYGGVMDTVIYRLRQAVEPDPHNPVHIVTVKRRGVRLDNTL